MVDSVKNTGKLVPFKNPKAESASLKENFSGLRSGVKVAPGAERQASDAQSSVRPRSKDDLSNTLKKLNEAVSFSRLALDALGKVAREDVPEIQELKENLSSVLGGLESNAQEAELVEENYEAAGARIEDVDDARRHAEDTRSEIGLRGREALNAHGAISANLVTHLLSE